MSDNYETVLRRYMEALGASDYTTIKSLFAEDGAVTSPANGERLELSAPGVVEWDTDQLAYYHLKSEAVEADATVVINFFLAMQPAPVAKYVTGGFAYKCYNKTVSYGEECSGVIGTGHQCGDDYECDEWATSQCDDSCDSSCDDGCDGGCNGSCDSCNNGRKNCNGSCDDNCNEDCDGNCNSRCNEGCEGEFTEGCDSGCECGVTISGAPALRASSSALLGAAVIAGHLALN